MKILPFRRAAPPVVDWSQQELADFYRAHRLLADNGVTIGLDRGLSDDGDPWMAFYDTATQDPFLHVARFDGRCILVCEHLAIRLSGTSVGDLVTTFEAEVRSVVTARAERAGNVVTHPAARIIMSISAVFLLFKLDQGGTAQARPLGADAILDAASRKHDVGTSGRVQQALTRLLDMAEAPAAAAALAGAILTVELSRAALKDGEALPESMPVASDHVEGAPHLQAHGFGDMLQSLDEQTAAASHVPHVTLASNEQALASVELSLRNIPHDIQQIKPAPELNPPTPPTPVEQPQPERPAAETITTQPTASAPLLAAVHATDLQPSITIVSTETSTLAAKAVQPLVALSDAAPLPADLLPKDATPVVGSVVGEITIAALSELGAEAGLVLETALSGAALNEAIETFLARFDGYEVEFGSAGVMIEQSDMAGLSADLVGIWTNVMADGSSISVVGQVDVISGVTALLG